MHPCFLPFGEGLKFWFPGLGWHENLCPWHLNSSGGASEWASEAHGHQRSLKNTSSQSVCKLPTATWGKDNPWESEDWTGKPLTDYWTISWVRVIATLPSKLNNWRRSTPQQPCSSPYSSYGPDWSNGLSPSCMHKFSSSSANRALKNWNLKRKKKRIIGWIYGWGMKGRIHWVSKFKQSVDSLKGKRYLAF